MAPMSNASTDRDPRIEMVDQVLSEHRMLGAFAARANAARRFGSMTGDTLSARPTLAPRRVLRPQIRST